MDIEKKKTCLFVLIFFRDNYIVIGRPVSRQPQGLCEDKDSKKIFLSLDNPTFNFPVVASGL